MASRLRLPRIVTILTAVSGCANETSDRVPVPGRDGATKTSAALRALRRAYDGAPPVIPHDPIGAACQQCHDADGLAVEDLGFAPANPHAFTPGLSAMSNCQQCHVYQKTEAEFVANQFEGFPQDLRKGQRLNAYSPPVIPHPIFMRENCEACHDGPAAREEIRCQHPERTHCQQCHVPRTTIDQFLRSDHNGV
jgi:cytochrome c-type protein NapB